MIRGHRLGCTASSPLSNTGAISTLIEAAGNDVLVSTHKTLMAKVRRPRFFAILSDARWQESVSEHLAIQAGKHWDLREVLS